MSWRTPKNANYLSNAGLKITPNAQNYAVVGGEVAERTPRNPPAAHPLGPGALTVTDSALNVADLDLAPMARAH